MTMTGTPAVPGETFWARPDARAAARRMDLSEVLRLVRQHTDLSQADMARLTGLSATSISRDLNGRRKITNHLHIRAALDRLGAPRSVWEHPEPLTDTAPPVEPGALLEVLGRSAVDLVHQAEAEAVSAWSAAAVDDQLRGAADRYLTVPIDQTLADLVQIDTRVGAWRRQALPLSRAREVWALTGWHAALTGWICVDRGRPDLAGVHARAAQMCAEHSGHEGVAAWAAMVRRTMAYWQSRRRQGADHAAAGLAAARRVGGGAHLITLSALAQDQAYLGEHEQAVELLVQARQVLERQDSTPDSDLGGPLACPPSRAYGYWVETLVDMGRSGEAVMVAEEGLEVAAEQMVRNHGSERMLQVHRALALARVGRVEDAVAAVEPILATPVSVRAQPLKLRLRQVGRSLPAGTETSTLRQRINEFARP